MTNTYNIAGTDGSVLVPVLSETGSLMVYVLYEDPIGLLRNPYSCMSIPRALPEQSQSIRRQYPEHFPTIQHPLHVGTCTIKLLAVSVMLGIEYYQRVNSRRYALKTSEHNATSIILVDKAV
jgi:hypothetical protein